MQLRTSNEFLQVRLKISTGGTTVEDDELIKLKDRTIDELLDKITQLKDSQRDLDNLNLKFTNMQDHVTE